MKRIHALTLAAAAAFVLGAAAPASAADYQPYMAPPAGPPPTMTCLENAWAHYRGTHPRLARPFILTRAALCRLVHPLNRVPRY